MSKKILPVIAVTSLVSMVLMGYPMAIWFDVPKISIPQFYYLASIFFLALTSVCTHAIWWTLIDDNDPKHFGQNPKKERIITITTMHLCVLVSVLFYGLFKMTKL